MAVCFFIEYLVTRDQKQEKETIQCDRVRMKTWYFGMRQVSHLLLLGLL